MFLERIVVAGCCCIELLRCRKKRSSRMARGPGAGRVGVRSAVGDDVGAVSWAGAPGGVRVEYSETLGQTRFLSLWSELDLP